MVLRLGAGGGATTRGGTGGGVVWVAGVDRIACSVFNDS
jgi:hypothetical protein